MGIEWRDSLAIGVEVIDNQHRELLSRFDKLLRACEHRAGIEELRPLLDFLSTYVVQHFSDEEQIQRQQRYPGYSAHKLEHKGFVAHLAALREEVDAEGAALHHVMEVNNLLLKWLIHHISTVDVQLGRFLRDQKS